MSVENLLWRVRLAVLWIFAGGGWVVGFALNLLLPGSIEGIIAGYTGTAPITEARLLLYALFYVLPFVMALLCLTLHDSLNRWLNVLFGSIFGVVLGLDLAIHTLNLVNGGHESVAIWLVMLTDLLLCLVISVLAWRKRIATYQR